MSINDRNGVTKGGHLKFCFGLMQRENVAYRKKLIVTFTVYTVHCGANMITSLFRSL